MSELQAAWSPSVVRTRGPRLPWHLDALQIPSIWPRTIGVGVTVAVLDSGIAEVDGLARERVASFDADGRSTERWDSCGHGTACASVIGSSRAATWGVAPGVELLSIDVGGPQGDPTAASVEAGLATATRLNADVISCSFVLPEVSAGLRDRVREAALRGLVVVAAAGNDATRVCAFPEQTPHAITVAALNKKGWPLPSAQLGSWIDVCAPGEFVPASMTDGRIGLFGESSAAAAIVAGVCALMLATTDRGSARRRQLGLQLEGLLRARARPVTEVDPQRVGAGCVDPVRLLEAILAMP